MTIKSSETLHQCLTLLTVAFNELSIGMSNGWIAPTLHSLSHSSSAEFEITSDESSWIASLDNVGKIFGAILAVFAVDVVGRKIPLTCSAFIFFIMWLATLLARSATVLCWVRFVCGVFIGINDGTNSAYLAENSSPVIRNVFGAMCMSVYYIGVLAEFVNGTYLTYKQAAAVNAAVAFLAFTSVVWIKEPVQYLLMKGKLAQAEKNFVWLHGYGSLDSDEWKSQFEEIKTNVRRENLKKKSLKETITSAANYKSLFIMISIYCLAGCSGYIPIIAYGPMTFSATETFSSNDFIVFMGIIQTIATVPGSFLVSRFDRRSVIMMLYGITALSHTITFSLYYTNKNIVPIPYFAWAIFFSITCSVTVNAIVYPAIFLIRGELFPLSIKAAGTCLSIVGFSLMSFVFTKMFLFLTRNFGIEANFILFAVFCTAHVVFVYFFLPETRNKSLIEIQDMLEKSKSLRS